MAAFWLMILISFYFIINNNVEPIEYVVPIELTTCNRVQSTQLVNGNETKV